MADFGAPCELLPWDTDFFGTRIARLLESKLDEAQAERAEEWARIHQVQCLYFLAQANDSSTIRVAENYGFRLVDIRMGLESELSKSLQPRESDTQTDIVVRPFVLDDLESLQEIAKDSHTNTRFFSDVNFARKRSQDMYSTWIRLDCLGRAQKVFVAYCQQEQRPVGYVSCHFDQDSKIGKIGLLGVSEKFQRKKIGRGLVNFAMEWFGAQGATRAIVITQGGNISALKLYQDCGFLICSVELWYHKWCRMESA